LIETLPFYDARFRSAELKSGGAGKRRRLITRRKKYMDINTLRVFNSIHSLGITEEEFADLESEQTHIERTGLYIRSIKKDYAICVSHDDLKHPIVIKKLDKTIQTPSRVLFKTLITFDNLPPEIYPPRHRTISCHGRRDQT